MPLCPFPLQVAMKFQQVKSLCCNTSKSATQICFSYISLRLGRFGSGVTSCPNFKFPSRFKTFSLGGRRGIFFKGPVFVSVGGVGLQLSQIESQESAVAHRVFLPLLVSSIKSLCQRHPPNFTERKKNLQIKGHISYLVSSVYNHALCRLWSGIVPEMRNFLLFIDRSSSNQTWEVHNAHILILSMLQLLCQE